VEGDEKKTLLGGRGRRSITLPIEAMYKSDGGPRGGKRIKGHGIGGLWLDPKTGIEGKGKEGGLRKLGGEMEEDYPLLAPSFSVRKRMARGVGVLGHVRRNGIEGGVFLEYSSTYKVNLLFAAEH